MISLQMRVAERQARVQARGLNFLQHWLKRWGPVERLSFAGILSLSRRDFIVKPTQLLD